MISLKENSNINLHLYYPKINENNKKILILGNTIGFFGYSFKEFGNDFHRYAWFANAIQQKSLFTIIGTINEKKYYDDLISSIINIFRLKFLKNNYKFYLIKENDNYFEKFNLLIKDMKFDYVIMNPPYNNSLGDSFLNKILDISNIIISVQPLSYLYKGKNGNIKIKKKLERGYTKIETIDANSIFDAFFQNSIAILFYNKISKINKKIIDENEIETFDNIKRYFNDKLITEFSKIVNPLIKEHNCFKEWFGTPGSHYPERYIDIDKENPEAYVVQSVQLRGNVSSKFKDGKAPDFYTMITNNQKLIETQFIGKYKDLIKLKDNKGKLKLQYYFKFNSKNEAYNFLNYIQTDFARTCLYLEKKDINVYWRSIPWFDFSDEHFSKSPKEIDDWLFEKYNISNEIRKHIEKILPDYYNIR